MKIFALVLVLFLGVNPAFANENSAVVLEGKTIGSSEPCALTIEKWEFPEGEEVAWWSVKATVRSDWQLEGNAALELSASPTPWTLHAKSKSSPDRIAVTLTHGTEITPALIQKYIFQSWDEERGLVQKACRFF